jgi:uncharacterized membrane protein
MTGRRKKKTWLILMVILYVGAGIYHFINPEFYMSVIPGWLPYHSTLVWTSGVAEIVLGLLLIFPRTQHAAAWAINVMLLIFLVCIHVPMALDFNGWDDWKWWIAIARLPLQYFLMAWAWRYSRGRVVAFWENRFTREQ